MAARLGLGRSEGGRGQICCSQFPDPAQGSGLCVWFLPPLGRAGVVGCESRMGNLSSWFLLLHVHLLPLPSARQ